MVFPKNINSFATKALSFSAESIRNRLKRYAYKTEITIKQRTMIKQDYLIRMIQEIISLISNAILNKKKFRKDEWTEYDCLTEQILGLTTEKLMYTDIHELIERYKDDPDKMGKIELAAMTMLKISDETESNLLLKSKFRQDGLALLKYVQKEDRTFSIQRIQLIGLLEMNN